MAWTLKMPLGMWPIVLLAAQAIPPNDLAASPERRNANPASVDFSLRAVAGVGGGSIGPGARAGLESEYWFAPHYGFGLVGGVDIQDEILARESDLTFAGPAFSYRSASGGSWWLLGVSSGYAYRVDEEHRLCLFGSCDGGGTTRRHGVYFGATAGWLAHGGPVEMGPVFRLDASATELGVDALVTLNLALGFALK